MRRLFATFANRAARAVGSSAAFRFGLGTFILWAITGPIFDYAESWQLVISTGTTIVTFQMVFLIYHTQTATAWPGIRRLMNSFDAPMLRTNLWALRNCRMRSWKRCIVNAAPPCRSNA